MDDDVLKFARDLAEVAHKVVVDSHTGEIANLSEKRLVQLRLAGAMLTIFTSIIDELEE